jgi:hypothetical protein
MKCLFEDVLFNLVHSSYRDQRTFGWIPFTLHTYRGSNLTDELYVCSNGLCKYAKQGTLAGHWNILYNWALPFMPVYFRLEAHESDES